MVCLHLFLIQEHLKKKKVKWRYLNDYTAYLTQTFQAANTLAMETAIGNNSWKTNKHVKESKPNLKDSATK